MSNESFYPATSPSECFEPRHLQHHCAAQVDSIHWPERHLELTKASLNDSWRHTLTGTDRPGHSDGGNVTQRQDLDSQQRLSSLLFISHFLLRPSIALLSSAKEEKFFYFWGIGFSWWAFPTIRALKRLNIYSKYYKSYSIWELHSMTAG